MPDSLTPAGVITGFWRWFWVGLLGLALLLALILGGWRLGWWFTEQNVNRQAHVTQEGYANQQGQLAALDNDLTTITGIDVQLRTSPAAAEETRPRPSATASTSQPEASASSAPVASPASTPSAAPPPSASAPPAAVTVHPLAPRRATPAHAPPPPPDSVPDRAALWNSGRGI